MRDRGFGFTGKNPENTVTIKIQVHWDREAPIGAVTSSLTQAYAEAMNRALEAGDGSTAA